MKLTYMQSTLLVSTLLLIGTGCWVSSEVRSSPVFEPSDNVYTAAEEGDLEAVQRFMQEASWDPSAINHEGYLPLSCAAKGGNVDIIYLMVADGADVNLEDSRGMRPLEYAREAGHEDAVQYLQELGATPQ